MIQFIHFVEQKPTPRHLTSRKEEAVAMMPTRLESQRQRTEARVAMAPAMEFVDNKMVPMLAWRRMMQRNADKGSYGSCIFGCAERWARLMQLELSEGKPLSDVWAQTAHEADFGGMSSYGFSIAVQILAKHWRYGAELKGLYDAYWGRTTPRGNPHPAAIVEVAVVGA